MTKIKLLAASAAGALAFAGLVAVIGAHAQTTPPPAPTGSDMPTSTLPRVNQPMLSINPNGMFLARGMTVTSVSSGSFQGTVWGITYTVNLVAGHEFYLRQGNKSSAAPMQQLAVGDEVGVAGKITTDAPFVVNGNIVRDYSILKMRENHGECNQGFPGNVMGILSSSTGSSTFNSSTDPNGRLQDLLKRLKDLQDKFHGNSGNGGGGDSGNPGTSTSN